MAQIQIIDLTFVYPGGVQPVFEQVNLDLDTNWRLGLIGRNGRGKTSFLRLLMGDYEYQGTILSPVTFEYFPQMPPETAQTALAVARQAIAPFDDWEREMKKLAEAATPAAMDAYGEIEAAYAAADGYIIDESIAVETGRLGVHPDVLEQPYNTLSGGERVKLMLAALFLKKHRFLLIDEPTDHLDAEGRKTVARWLAGKSGFILVSHDRDFIDTAVDHILSINRADIELQKGNYSSWRHNRTLQDEHEQNENRRLEADISHLKAASERTKKWSDKIESSKTGTQGSTYKRGPASVDRGYIGHQAAKMMQRSKAIENRRGRQIEEKQSLLKNIETAEALKFHVLKADKDRLVTAEGASLAFGGRSILSNLSFTIDVGDRVAISGANGSGKSTLLKMVSGKITPQQGSIQRMSSLVCSVLAQDTDGLAGELADFAAAYGVDLSLFMTLLRKLNFEREAFDRRVESYSAGQKKKVCLAASLAKPAHLFIWDEPLNYIDVYSREQIEDAVLACAPTMLFVEHDQAFQKRIATKTINLCISA